ncbi:glycosyltransferase family 2 protein [Legionella waltersii]|uniref:Glycosyltransferase n=1 Tax=Legionella waltersii TaxID=66969 RepID=A0A0W1A2C6_9GAMM|nr:glycosyltransferase family 2 protein [Legionella waltersii]KTD75511.1 glycosyltransferase [Legionella waltersii]SNU98412.1 glycosyltransferase [Legionella waltersii]
MQKEKVIIIIPTYNEEENIAQTIHQILECTDQVQDFQIEVLVFDSNSKDSTAGIVKSIAEHCSRVHFAQEPFKTGLGSAYLQAMNIAMSTLNADIVFEFDADGSHQPQYIVPMLETMKTHDVVVGSRYVPGGSIPKNWGWHRKFLSVVGNWIARLVLTRKYKDLTSGLRAVRTNVLKKVLPSQFLSSQYAYKVELFWLLVQSKATVSEYPIEFIDREKGNSKLPRNSIVDTLRVLFRLRQQDVQQYVKMCSVGLLGAIIQFSLYNYLRSIHFSAFFASQIAISAAIVSNFTLNNAFTFQEKLLFKWTKPYFLIRLFQFIVYSVAMIFLQSSFVHMAVEFMGSGVLKENLMVAVGIGIGSIINYLFYSNVIWSKQLPDQPLEQR